jgi:pyrroline-5-carboxylate reductase
MTAKPFPSVYKIAFLGAGRMATALARGFVKSGQVAPQQISAADTSPASLQSFSAHLPGCALYEDGRALPQDVDLLVLAVKPQVAGVAIPPLKALFSKTKVLSVIAGIRLQKLEHWLGTDQLIRCMPNTPSLVNAGAIGITSHSSVCAGDLELVEGLLRSVGQVVRTTEPQLDAVTGLSGSGPAYVFSFIRALITGGVQAGLTPQAAEELALQTVFGAVELLRRSQQKPEELIAQVSSPGGTTLRGLEVLAAGGFEKIVADCVMAAAKRAEELGRADA